MKRQKYDLMLAIVYFGLQDKFLAYQKKHRDISLNRCARSFLVAEKVDYKTKAFELDFVKGVSPVERAQKLYRIVHAEWLG